MYPVLVPMKLNIF